MGWLLFLLLLVRMGFWALAWRGGDVGAVCGGECQSAFASGSGGGGGCCYCCYCVVGVVVVMVVDDDSVVVCTQVSLRTAKAEIHR